MANSQHDEHVGDVSATGQTEEARPQETSALSAARLVANPRRVRLP